jgi:hypothetical protein
MRCIEEEKLIENIREIHLQVHETLKNSHEKYKALNIELRKHSRWETKFGCFRTKKSYKVLVRRSRLCGMFFLIRWR